VALLLRKTVPHWPDDVMNDAVCDVTARGRRVLKAH